MKKTIAVLGGGAIATAKVIELSKKHLIKWWLRDKKEAKILKKTRENKKYLPGYKIPEEVFISSDIGEVIEGADLIISAVPASGVREISQAVSEVLVYGRIRKRKRLLAILGVAKGVEKEGQQLSSQIFEDVLKGLGVPYIQLSITGFAKQIAEGESVVEVLASNNDQKLTEKIAKILETPKSQIILSNDLIGVQLGGVLKNVLAIAVGFVEETRKNKKIREKIVYLCLEELVRVGTGLGGEPATLEGFAGRGDLTSTLSSFLSRNYDIGKRIAKEGIPAIREEIKERKTTYEGLESVEALWQMCQEQGIDAPVIREVYLVTCEGKPAEESVKDLIKLTKTKERA